MSQEQVVKAMEDFATFRRDQNVHLGREGRRRIVARKWDLQNGTFIYRVEGVREGHEWSIAQNELEQRIKGAEEENEFS